MPENSEPRILVAPDYSAHDRFGLVSLRGHVVTAAAAGIGLAAARPFADAGASIVVIDVDRSGAENASRMLSGKCGVAALEVATDMGSGHAVAELADRAVSAFGQLDIWMPAHCATGCVDLEFGSLAGS